MLWESVRKSVAKECAQGIITECYEELYEGVWKDSLGCVSDVYVCCIVVSFMGHA